MRAAKKQNIASSPASILDKAWQNKNPNIYLEACKIDLTL